MANCPPGSPLSCIDKTIAQRRMSFFQIKKDILSGMHAHVSDFTSIDITALINVLRSFSNSPNNYDGVRVYFALSDNRPQPGFNLNTIYIVLVPTMPTTLIDINTDIISDDDEINASIITVQTGPTPPNYTLKAINLDTDRYIGRWIKRYAKKVVPQIELAYRNNYNIGLDETHSLWYSKRVMFYNDPSDHLGPDLLTYLTDPAHTFTGADICFASWTLNPPDPTEPPEPPFAFKASLVFRFMELGFATPFHFSFEMNDMINNIQKSDKGMKISTVEKDKMIRTLKETYTDTGNPCPGKKCP